MTINRLQVGNRASKTATVVTSLKNGLLESFLRSYKQSLVGNCPTIFIRFVEANESANEDLIKRILGKQEYFLDTKTRASIAANWNSGLKSARKRGPFKYYFVFNDDVFFPRPDRNHPHTWKENWVQFMEKNPEIGISSPAWHGNTKEEVQHCWGYGSANSGKEEEGIQGCFFCIRNEVVDEVLENDGYLFDEKFDYGNWEDVDFVKRVENLGWKTKVFHSLALSHMGGQTVYDPECVPEGHSEKNRQYFFKKWDLDPNSKWTVRNARLILG